MTIKYLKWDSDFFNKRVGELYIKNTDANIHGIGNFELFYLKSPFDISIILKGFENTFTEIKVVFSKAVLGSKKNYYREIKSVHDTSFELKELYELALESGKFSRFKLDENFSNEVFIHFYKIWIDNSLNKTYADDVLVYKEEGKIHGLISYKVDKNIAKVGLLGINPIMQGKGMGTKLIDSLEDELYRQGVEKISISTQLKNLNACNFYSKLGYTIEEKIFIRHYWKI